MLTVAKVTQGQAAGYADYLEGRSAPSSLGDYYLKDGDRVEAPGRWAGGALALGADGERPLSGDELRALMAVRRPDNGLPLRHAGATGEAVAAIDATFSAPKSVSAVWALADAKLRARIEQAQEQAIDRALAHATRVVAMVRERIDRDTVIHTRAQELVATSWRHATARAVQDQPPDPQLHSHVLLHAAIRRDGRVVAIDSRSWLVHRREVGAAYRTELARELAHVGFQIQRGTGRGGRYFELDGIPTELIDRWSSRHWQVREAIDARVREKRAALERLVADDGPDASRAAERLEALAHAAALTPAEDRHLTTATRAAKSGVETSGDLDRHWSETAKSLGLDRRAVQGLCHGRVLLEVATEHELLLRLTEFEATFAQRDARAVALEASAGTSVSESLEVLRRLRSTGELLALAQGHTTTGAHRRAERRTVGLAQWLAAAKVEPLPEGIVARRTEELDEELRGQGGGGLSEEQRAAIRLACSERRLVLIEGHAGSGKSTTLRAVARVHRDTGQQIVVTSTAALAVERLAEEIRHAGVEAKAYSTVALQAAQRAGGVVLDPFTTVICDEAALASTREQQQLLSGAEAAGARVILLGDPRQSQAVGAGGLWPELHQATAEHGAWVQLAHNVRAHDQNDREAQQLFRAGEHRRALESYAQRDRVHIADQQRQAEDAALDAAQADRLTGKRTLVIAQTSNEHLDELNARAQAIRLQNGELGQKGVRVAGRPYLLYEQDEVQVRRSIRHPERGRLRNGTTGKVIDADTDNERVVVRLTDGAEITLEREQLYEADLRLAYVQHPFPAQGRTTDTAHVIVAEHTIQEGSYVAITRARERTDIHASREQLGIDDTEEYLDPLVERLSRSEPEIPSIRYPLAFEAHLRDEHPRELEDDSQAERARQSPSRLQRDSGARRDAHPEGREAAPPHLVAALGEPPEATEELEAWQRTTEALELYEIRYRAQTTERSPEQKSSSTRLSARYEQRQIAERVLDALADLDPSLEANHLLQERVLARLGLGHGYHEPDRGIGWEP